MSHIGILKKKKVWEILVKHELEGRIVDDKDRVPQKFLLSYSPTWEVKKESTQPESYTFATKS